MCSCAKCSTPQRACLRKFPLPFSLTLPLFLLSTPPPVSLSLHHTLSIATFEMNIPPPLQFTSSCPSCALQPPQLLVPFTAEGEAGTSRPRALPCLREPVGGKPMAMGERITTGGCYFLVIRYIDILTMTSSYPLCSNSGVDTSKT